MVSFLLAVTVSYRATEGRVAFGHSLRVQSTTVGKSWRRSPVISQEAGRCGKLIFHTLLSSLSSSGGPKPIEQDCSRLGWVLLYLSGNPVQKSPHRPDRFISWVVLGPGTLIISVNYHGRGPPRASLVTHHQNCWVTRIHIKMEGANQLHKFVL